MAFSISTLPRRPAMTRAQAHPQADATTQGLPDNVYKMQGEDGTTYTDAPRQEAGGSLPKRDVGGTTPQERYAQQQQELSLPARPQQQVAPQSQEIYTPNLTEMAQVTGMKSAINNKYANMQNEANIKTADGQNAAAQAAINSQRQANQSQIDSQQKNDHFNLSLDDNRTARAQQAGQFAVSLADTQAGRAQQAEQFDTEMGLKNTLSSPEYLASVEQNKAKVGLMAKQNELDATNSASLQKEADIRKRDSTDTINILNEAEKLTGQATNSYAGKATDEVAAFFGHATDSGKAAAQLKVLGGFAQSKVPKMSGPQSDKDTAMYKEMAASIADPTIPSETKNAAIKTLWDLNLKYAGENPEIADAIKQHQERAAPSKSQQEPPKEGYRWATNPATGEKMQVKWSAQ